MPLVAAFVCFVCGLVPSKFLGDFDRHFLRIKSRGSAPLWTEGFRRAYFAFNIQQIVFAIAVLIAGSIGVSDAIIFDFHSVVYMALMSWTAHLLTSIHLRDRFLESRCFRNIELATVLTILIFLCVALFPTTNWRWANDLLTRSDCTKETDCSGWQESVASHWQVARHGIKHRGLSPQGVLSYLIPIASFILYALSLLWTDARFPRCLVEKFLVLLAQKAVGASEEIGYGRKGVKTRLIDIYRRSLLGIYCLSFAILGVTSSFAFSLWMLTAALAWDTMQLFLPRFYVLRSYVRARLNQWGLGQILALAILLIPVYTILEYLTNTKEAISGRFYHVSLIHRRKSNQR